MKPCRQDLEAGPASLGWQGWEIARETRDVLFSHFSPARAYGRRSTKKGTMSRIPVLAATSEVQALVESRLSWRGSDRDWLVGAFGGRYRNSRFDRGFPGKPQNTPEGGPEPVYRGFFAAMNSADLGIKTRALLR